MSTTIYATFPTPAAVERAVGALLDHGVPATAVSLVAPERMPHLGTGDASISPQPPIAPVVNHSTLDAVRQVNPDEIDRVVVDHGSMRISTPEGEVITSVAQTPALASNTPEEVILNDTHAHIVDMHRGRPPAADGISTTTAGDAGKGALEGTGIGLGAGILLGLATVAIPGFGLVAGSGALVAGLAAATGAAGGVAGLVYGYLVDLGVSPDHAQHLTGHLDNGGLILSVSMGGPFSEAHVIELLQKYGATSAEAF